MTARAWHDSPSELTAEQVGEMAHPTRGRMIELCGNTARTNKELADALGIDPATALYHVRHLVDLGLLDEQPIRRGTRGSREKPYLASSLVDTAHELLTAAQWHLEPVSVTDREARELRRAITELVDQYRARSIPTGRRRQTVTITATSRDK